MGSIRGIDCQVYVNTSVATDPYAAPVWSLWDCVRDTKLDLSTEEADNTCRASGGFSTSEPVLTNLEVSGNAIKDKADPSYIAIELAAVQKTKLDLLVLDGPKASADSDGWRIQAQITGWSENQAYKDIVTVDFTIKPTLSNHPPIMVSGPFTT